MIIFNKIKGIWRDKMNTLFKYKSIYIINAQHSLLKAQSEFLPDECEVLQVPASGWTLEEMKKKRSYLRKYDLIIFVSPIPYLIKELAPWKDVKVFHNDVREKKELPNGKVIMTVAKEGWQLV